MRLFMIRIDHLMAGDNTGGGRCLEELLLNCGVSDRDLEAGYIGDRDDSPAKRVDFPASTSSHKGPRSVRDHQNERIVIVSCGAHNFELTCAAKRNKAKFRTYVGLTQGADPDKDKTIHVDLSDPDIKDQFMETFQSCYPDLCRDRKWLFFDCLTTQVRASSSGPMFVSSTRS